MPTPASPIDVESDNARGTGVGHVGEKKTMDKGKEKVKDKGKGKEEKKKSEMESGEESSGHEKEQVDMRRSRRG